MDNKSRNFGLISAGLAFGFCVLGGLTAIFGGSTAISAATGLFFIGMAVFAGAVLLLIGHEVEVVDEEHDEKKSVFKKVDITPKVDRNLTRDAIRQIAQMKVSEKTEKTEKSQNNGAEKQIKQEKPEQSVQSAAPGEPSAEPSSILHVSNLSIDVTEDNLRELFGEIGAVQSVRIVMDKYRGMSKGYGFVDMGEPDAARQAIEKINGKEIKGRTVQLAYAKNKPYQPRARSRY